MGLEDLLASSHAERRKELAEAQARLARIEAALQEIADSLVSGAQAREIATAALTEDSDDPANVD